MPHGCGCYQTARKQGAKSHEQLAQLMAEAENQIYIIYINNGKENFTTEKGWEADGRSGEIKAVVYP